MVTYPKHTVYSEKYADSKFEYRHVILQREQAAKAKSKMSKKRDNLLSETEWRDLGIQQSAGWMHYMVHAPEPHVMLFRRPLGCDPMTGRPPADWNPPTDDRGRGPLPPGYQRR
ncbi:MAG: uncharacterized protein KVP18_000289 [Porospora cf. gigantea A]|uniref:uncharacterized protein n=1 Tax=Porospora cf. gigantea A TaxID=2853593 RepID=UPI003559FCE3|nr:MAG: hypothetical protein KVP18_000289 [Porospora cf. gigantea A]